MFSCGTFYKKQLKSRCQLICARSHGPEEKDLKLLSVLLIWYCLLQLTKIWGYPMAWSSSPYLVTLGSSWPCLSISKFTELSGLDKMLNKWMVWLGLFFWKDAVQFGSVTQSCLTLCCPTWTAARQASLSITNSRSLLKLMPIESVMPFNHLILCCALLLLPSVFPASGSFQGE